MPRRILWTMTFFLALAALSGTARATKYPEIANLEIADGHMTATLLPLKGLGSVCQQLVLMLKPVDMDMLACTTKAINLNKNFIHSKDGTDAPASTPLALPFVADQLDVLKKLGLIEPKEDKLVLTFMPKGVIEEKRSKISQPQEQEVETGQTVPAAESGAASAASVPTAPLASELRAAAQAESQDITPILTIAKMSLTAPAAIQEAVQQTSSPEASPSPTGAPAAECAQIAMRNANSTPSGKPETDRDMAIRVSLENDCLRLKLHDIRIALGNSETLKTAATQSMVDEKKASGEKDKVIAHLQTRLSARFDTMNWFQYYLPSSIANLLGQDSFDGNVPKRLVYAVVVVGILAWIGSLLLWIRRRLYFYRFKKAFSVLTAEKERLEKELEQTRNEKDRAVEAHQAALLESQSIEQTAIELQDRLGAGTTVESDGTLPLEFPQTDFLSAGPLSRDQRTFSFPVFICHDEPGKGGEESKRSYIPATPQEVRWALAHVPGFLTVLSAAFRSRPDFPDRARFEPIVDRPALVEGDTVLPFHRTAAQ